ncbi:MAG: AAA family ATPase [Patescibacteria group bacterium]|nr:AAA family ATPase [Patescibacteria group bacterium]
MKIILGLVGEIASGKGTTVEYLEKKYNAASFRFSDPLRGALKQLYLDVNRKNMQVLSLILRQTFGQNLFAKIISQDAKNNKKKVIVVDGIRRPADIEYLKQLPEFKLVYITIDIKIRYQRLIKRTENSDDKNKTFDQFVKDHTAETELEIPKIGQTADYKINNSGSKKKLFEQIDKIVCELECQ